MIPPVTPVPPNDRVCRIIGETDGPSIYFRTLDALDRNMARRRLPGYPYFCWCFRSGRLFQKWSGLVIKSRVTCRRIGPPVVVRVPTLNVISPAGQIQVYPARDMGPLFKVTRSAVMVMAPRVVVFAG